MAKCKYTDARITDIQALLDKDENGNFIICLEDEQFELDKILEAHVGDEISLKFTRNLCE
jgi:hypothetical protein